MSLAVADPAELTGATQKVAKYLNYHAAVVPTPADRFIIRSRTFMAIATLHSC